MEQAVRSLGLGGATVPDSTDSGVKCDNQSSDAGHHGSNTNPPDPCSILLSDSSGFVLSGGP